MNAFPRNPDAAGNRSHFIRAAFAYFFARATGPNVYVGDVAAQRWRNDETTGAVLRAITSPLQSADLAPLMQSAVVDFLTHLSMSAGSRLLVESLNLPIEPYCSLTVPFDATPALAGATWVGEGKPIPVQSGTVGAATLGPARKLGIIFAFSRESARNPAGERLFGHMLRERAAREFDAALFSDDAADDDRAAGLLHGVTALDAGPMGNLTEALGALAGALGSAGGSGRVVIAAHPSTAALIQLHHPQLVWPVLATRALMAGHIVAIDPAGLLFGMTGNVDISAVNSGLVHMSSTPAEIVSSTGPTTADPVSELFQIDAIGMRLLLDVAFTAKPGAVQHVIGGAGNESSKVSGASW